MPTNRRRRLPRSRQELRERAQTSSSPPLPHPLGVANIAGTSCPCAPPQVPMPIAVAPVVAPIVIVPAVAANCLYAPYDCSVYRYPPQWCSWCQVRAASMCAQLGQPDIRMVFRPACPMPVARFGACQPACYQPAACPTSAATTPYAACPLPACPLPACSLPPCSLPPCTSPAATCPVPEAQTCTMPPQPAY